MQPEWTTDTDGVSRTTVEDITIAVRPNGDGWSWLIETPFQRYAYGLRFRTEEACRAGSLIEVGHLLRLRKVVGE